MVNLHSKEEDKVYKCETCDKRFSKKHMLTSHHRLYHIRDEDKRFECHVCGQRLVYNFQDSFFFQITKFQMLLASSFYLSYDITSRESMIMLLVIFAISGNFTDDKEQQY